MNILSLFFGSARRIIIVRRIIISAISAVIILVILAGLFFWLRPAAPKRANGSILLTAIRNVNELVTVRGYFQGVADLAEYSRVLWEWGIPGTYVKFLLLFKGSMTCGINMSKAKVSIDGNKVSILLPHAEVLDTIVDLPSIREYDKQEGIFSKAITFEQRIKVVHEKMTEMKEEAISSGGILKQAENNAAMILMSFVNSIVKSANEEGEVEFDLSFYEEVGSVHEPAIRDLSLDIKKGDK